ncbi:MAG: RluA family pseudouridine synthase [Brachymonas sp.]|nr:RluA family pseudouridine synthase [Brachymonas sp.]
MDSPAPNGLPRYQAYAPPLDTGLEIVFQDEHLLVINKPAGLLSVPGRGADLADCALHRVRRRFPNALLVHRLDEATSGLLMFALHPAAQKAASWAFELRQVKKTYLALVHGLLCESEGIIDAPIAKDWPRRPLHKVDQSQGKRSITYWKLLSKDEHSAQSLCRLEPQTGRTHQLRVHMQHVGHPIIGDKLYGMEEDRANRLMLHASELNMPHPMQPDQSLMCCSQSPDFQAF